MAPFPPPPASFSKNHAGIHQDGRFTLKPTHSARSDLTPLSITISTNLSLPQTAQYISLPLLRLHTPELLSTLRHTLRRLLIRALTPIRQHLQILITQHLPSLAWVIALKVVLTKYILNLPHLVVLPTLTVPHTPELILLNDKFLKAPLAVRFFEEGLFDCAFSGETVDDDGFGLPDTVGAVLGLKVLLGVPVAVEEDDGVSRRKVDAKPAGTGGEEKELVALLGVEVIDGGGAVVGADGAVDAADGPAAKGEGPFCEDVQLLAELGEEDDLVAFLEESWYESVEHDHLP